MKEWLLRLSGWVAPALLVMLTVLLAYLFFGNVFTGKARGITVAFSALIIVVAVWAAWKTRPDDLATGSLSDGHLRTRRFAFLILAVLGAAALVAGLLPVFDSVFGPSEKVVGQDKAAPSILAKIEGDWGEQDCAVSFRFTLKDRALTIDSLRTPAGQARYRSVSTVVAASDDRLETRGEDFRGAVFSYWTNGIAEQLIWDDGRDTPPSKLRRCSGRRG